MAAIKYGRIRTEGGGDEPESVCSKAGCVDPMLYTYFCADYQNPSSFSVLTAWKPRAGVFVAFSHFYNSSTTRERGNLAISACLQDSLDEEEAERSC